MRLRLRACAFALVAVTIVAAATIPAEPASATIPLTVRAFDKRGLWQGATIGRWTSEPFSSAAVGNILTNAGDEVAVGGLDGWVHIFSAGDGAWITAVQITNRGLSDLRVDGVAGSQSVAPVNSSPALADLNHDGLDDIIATDMLGHVVGITGLGTVLFRQNACIHWRVSPHIYCDTFSSPAVADLNYDGVPEIAVSSMDHFLHVWSANAGTTPGAAEYGGFPRFLYDSSWSTPAIADLNGDGILDIAVGGDMDKNGGDGCCPASAVNGGGEMWAFSGAGAGLLWHTDLPGEVIYSSPAIGDINADGVPDVVFGTGQVFWPRSGAPASALQAARKVHALNGRTGQALSGWPVTLPGQSMVSPAIGNIDTDPMLEVVTMDRGGWVQAWNGAGGQFPQWSTCVSVNCNQDNFIVASPAIADVNGGGPQEIIVRGQAMDAGRSNTLYVLNNGGGIEASAPMGPIGGGYGTFQAQATPTVANVNGEARIFLATQVGNCDTCRLQPSLFAWGTGHALGQADWPSFHGQIRTRNGTIGPPAAVDIANTQDGRYVAKAFFDLLGRRVDADGQRYWWFYLRTYGREAFTRALVFAPSCEWPHAVVMGFYTTILGRTPPDNDAGVVYWTNRICSRQVLARQVAASFYGLPEYYNAHGGTPESFVDAAYRSIMGRAPDAGGLAYWSNRVRNEGSTRVAEVLYQQQEPREFRVKAQYQRLLHRAPDAGGLSYWANRLLSFDDLELTVSLTSSQEYYLSA